MLCYYYNANIVPIVYKNNILSDYFRILHFEKPFSAQIN